MTDAPWGLRKTCAPRHGRTLPLTEILMLAVLTAGCGDDSGGPAPLVCEPRPLVTPGPTSFVDISAASGIQVGNFDPAPANPIAINDHSRLAFVDLDGDGCDDIVA